MATMKKLKKKDRAIEMAAAPRISNKPIKRASGEAIPYIIIMTLIIMDDIMLVVRKLRMQVRAMKIMVIPPTGHIVLR